MIQECRGLMNRGPSKQVKALKKFGGLFMSCRSGDIKFLVFHTTSYDRDDRVTQG